MITRFFKKDVYGFGLILLLFFFSCQDEEIINPSQKALLTFSTDTISFDTLLTSRASITKRLRIYNKEKEAVKISDLRIAGGESSSYRLIVNSFRGNRYEDLIIAGGDSVLALIEVTIDPNTEITPFLVKDSLLVSWNGNQINVKLRAWGQEARYISEQIICDQTWDDQLPYVITKDVLVDSLCKLTIQPGTKIYLDNGVRFLVKGKLDVRGDTAREVLFRNSRFDENYVEAPGQWDGIYFLEGSTGNHFQHSIIENGRIGLRLGTPDQDTIPDVRIENTIIRHMSQNAIQSFTSDLYAENCLFYNSGSQLVFNVAGGNYTYRHCTFSNNPTFFIVDEPAILASDNITLGNNQQIIEPLSFEISNSIVDGSQDVELFFSITESVPFSLLVRNNIIHSETSISGNIIYQDANEIGFVNRFEFDYRLDSNSIAIDKGIDLLIEKDLEGMTRDQMPDIGAYEYLKN